MRGCGNGRTHFHDGNATLVRIQRIRQQEQRGHGRERHEDREGVARREARRLRYQGAVMAGDVIRIGAVQHPRGMHGHSPPELPASGVRQDPPPDDVKCPSAGDAREQTEGDLQSGEHDLHDPTASDSRR